MKWVRYFLICCLSLFVISCDKEAAVQPREEVSLKRDKSKNTKAGSCIFKRYETNVSYCK